MNLKKLLIPVVFVLMFSFAVQAEEKKTHVTIIVGTHHYTPNKSMPLLKAELERLGLEVALINPEWNPEKDKRGIEGMEVLKDTDLAIFFIRFLKLEDPQLSLMMDYVKAGKPVVGLRTSNHGFNYPKDHPKAELNTSFGRDVLGTPYLIHLAGSTKLEIIESEKNHPILTGVSGKWKSPGTLYLSKPQEGVKPLVQGIGKANPKRTGKVKNQFGTHDVKPVMTDNVAWTWTNKYGGKTFYASLGHTGDFAVENSMRIIVNGIYWAAGLSVPSADTDIKTFKLKGKKK